MKEDLLKEAKYYIDNYPDAFKQAKVNFKLFLGLYKNCLVSNGAKINVNYQDELNRLKNIALVSENKLALKYLEQINNKINENSTSETFLKSLIVIVQVILGEKVTYQEEAKILFEFLCKRVKLAALEIDRDKLNSLNDYDIVDIKSDEIMKNKRR